MQGSEQRFGGRIGPFMAGGMRAEGMVTGTYQLVAQQDPAWVNSTLLNAVNQVIGQKLGSNQVAIPTLQQSLPYFVPEILQQAQLTNVIANLQINVQVQSDQPAAPPPGPMPPTPMQSAQAAYAQAAQDQLDSLDPRNHEYEARINVGGFKIKASTDGGLDVDGLGKQAVDKAKSNLIWYGIGCFILLLVGVGILGLGLYIYSEANSSMSGSTPSGAGKAASWDGKTPFVCSGNQNLTLSGVSADISTGIGISASGNCKLSLSNVNVKAPTALSALGNAKITISGGSLEGSTAAINAVGPGVSITMTGTKVTGATKTLGGAKVTGP